MANQKDIGRKRVPKAPNDSQIWDSWPNEGRDQHFAFVVFRDSAYPNGYGGAWSRRTVSNTVRLLAEKHGTPISYSALYNWSNDFAWQDRARAFDLYLDSAASASVLDDLARTKRAQLRRMAKLAELGEAELDRHTARAERLNSNPRDIVPITRVPEVVDLLEKVTKTERLILGQSTEKVEGSGHTTQTVMDLSSASLADLQQIEGLRARFEIKGG